MPASRHQQRYSRVDSPHGRRTFHQRDARESWTLGLTTRSSRAVDRAADLTLAEAGIAELRPSRSTMRARLTIMPSCSWQLPAPPTPSPCQPSCSVGLGCPSDPSVAAWRPPHQQRAATSAALIPRLGRLVIVTSRIHGASCPVAGSRTLTLTPPRHYRRGTSPAAVRTSSVRTDLERVASPA